MSAFHAPGRPERVSAMNAILELLKEKPRTSSEIAAVGGLNSRARVSDARRAGYNIVVRKHPTKPHTNIYILLHGPRSRDLGPLFGEGGKP